MKSEIDARENQNPFALVDALRSHKIDPGILTEQEQDKIFSCLCDGLSAEDAVCYVFGEMR